MKQLQLLSDTALRINHDLGDWEPSSTCHYTMFALCARHYRPLLVLHLHTCAFSPPLRGKLPYTHAVLQWIRGSVARFGVEASRGKRIDPRYE